MCGVCGWLIGCRFDEISDVQSVKGGVDFRARFLHLMSLLHGVAIQYLLRGQVPLTIFGGISEEETVKLGKVQDQAYVVVHWLNKCIVKRCHEGGLAVAPPIQGGMSREGREWGGGRGGEERPFILHWSESMNECGCVWCGCVWWCVMCDRRVCSKS